MKAPGLLGTDRRPSPIAGRWYPAEPSRLAASVDAYLEAARPTAIEGTVVAVVAPHAGHTYSGPVAGYAFAALRGLAPDLGADRVRILRHATSGDTSGDRSRVVGYAAAVVTRAAGSGGDGSGGSP